MPARSPDFSRARVFRERLDWIAPYIRQGAVLDLGCIDERHPERIADSLHAQLKKINPALVGMDGDAQAIAAVAKLGFEIRLGDAQKDNLGGPYDCVFAGELIEHLPNPGLFLNNVLRHLKPEGRLLLTTPNPFYINQAAKIFKHREPQVHEKHCSWFSPETLSVLLDQSGFEIEDFVWFSPTQGPLRKALARLRRHWNPSFGIVARRSL